MDTETTGLDPAINEVIEVGAVLFVQGEDDENPKEFFRYACKLRADQGIVDLESTQINMRRLTEDLVLDTVVTADIQKDIIYGLADFLASEVTSNTFVIGGNIRFDVEFIKSLLNRHGIDGDRLFHRNKLIDIQQVARFLNDSGVIDVPNFKLRTLFKELDLGWWEGEHTAMADAVATAGVYFKMRDML